MREEVSVNKAIKTGFWLVKIPMYLIFMLIIVLKSIYFKIIFEKTIAIFVTIFIGFIVCWLYWSIAIPIWKIWAYTNVRNVNELKNKALKKLLISIDGGFFEKTEIRNYEQKEKLKQLEKKFLEDDVFQDDLSFPKEYKIFYSKIKLSFSLLMILCFIGALIYFIIKNNLFNKMNSSVFAMIFLFLLFSFFGYLNIKNLLNSNPQITISEDGIQIKEDKICLWENINNEIVYDKWTGRLNHNKYLSYNNGEILINDYDISMNKLENMLHVYRVRYEKKHPNES